MDIPIVDFDLGIERRTLFTLNGTSIETLKQTVLEPYRLI